MSSLWGRKQVRWVYEEPHWVLLIDIALLALSRAEVGRRLAAQLARATVCTLLSTAGHVMVAALQLSAARSFVAAKEATWRVWAVQLLSYEMSTWWLALRLRWHACLMPSGVN